MNRAREAADEARAAERLRFRREKYDEFTRTFLHIMTTAAWLSFFLTFFLEVKPAHFHGFGTEHCAVIALM